MHSDNSKKPSRTSSSKAAILKLLDWFYDKATSKLPGFDSAQELADDYLAKATCPEDAARSLVRWQVTKAGTAGFVTGLGGLPLLAITIPANLASVFYVQVQMIATIAHLGGYDVKSDQVKTLVYACLCGNGMKDLFKETCIVIGSKIATNSIKQISGKTLTIINQRVGFRLVTKFGEKGAINFGKAVPVLGGVIGGTFDSVTTKIVGKSAISLFLGP